MALGYNEVRRSQMLKQLEKSIRRNRMCLKPRGAECGFSLSNMVGKNGGKKY